MDHVGGVREFGAVGHQLQPALVEQRPHRCHPEIAAASLREHVIEGKRPVADRNDASAGVRKRGVIAGRELLAPIDMHMIFRPQRTVVRRCPDQHQLFLEQQLRNDARPGGSSIEDRHVQRAFLNLLHQSIGRIDVSADRDLRTLASHPQQPVSHQWIPLAELRADCDHGLPARRDRDRPPRTVPDLNERGRETEELLAGRRQPCAGLVADEHLAVELLLENSDPRADRGLGHVEIGGRADETAGLHDLEEGSSHVDVHVSPRSWSRDAAYIRYSIQKIDCYPAILLVCFISNPGASSVIGVDQPDLRQQPTEESPPMPPSANARSAAPQPASQPDALDPVRAPRTELHRERSELRSSKNAARSGK